MNTVFIIPPWVGLDVLRNNLYVRDVTRVMLLWVGVLSGEGGGYPSPLFLYLVSDNANWCVVAEKSVTSDMKCEG